MRNAQIAAVCLVLGIAAGSVSGLAGVDPVTAGLIGFGMAGLCFVFLSKRGQSGQ